jgi:hypothetical protein
MTKKEERKIDKENDRLKQKFIGPKEKKDCEIKCELL